MKERVGGIGREGESGGIAAAASGSETVEVAVERVVGGDKRGELKAENPKGNT